MIAIRPQHVTFRSRVNCVCQLAVVLATLVWRAPLVQAQSEEAMPSKQPAFLEKPRLTMAQIAAESGRDFVDEPPLPTPKEVGGPTLPDALPASAVPGPGEPAHIDKDPWQCLPPGRVWVPPYANQYQPRLYVKSTSLDTPYTQQTIDTAVGGIVGVWRYNSPTDPNYVFQFDVFGVNFSRWTQRHLAVGSDYRYGFPLTFGFGDGYHAKVGYEHTSTHLGDDLIKTFGVFKDPYVRDELVFGLDKRWWNELRLYGIFGYAFYIETPVPAASGRFDWGIEWSRQAPTGKSGQPFAAFDCDLRPEMNWQPNLTLQAGWQWIPDSQWVSFRLAGELYDGHSSYGQFLRFRERWAGIGVFADF